MLYYFSTFSLGFYKGANRITIVTTTNETNRAKIFSNENYTICPFFRKHSDALVSAHNILSFTSIVTERKNKQKLKKLIVCATKADRTHVNLL